MNPFALPRSLAAGLGVIAVAALVTLAVGGSALTWTSGVDLPGVAAQVDLGFSLDLVSATLLLFLASMAALVATYARRNLVGQRGYRRFSVVLAVTLVGLAVMVTGASLPMIALGWTASGLAIAALTAHAATPASERAARYVRRWLLGSDAAIWTGVLVAMIVLPSVNRNADYETSAATTAVAGLLLVGAIIRSALFPASRWLPETAEAPSPVSAFLHGGVVNGAGVLVVMMWSLFSAAPGALAVLLVVGLASVVVGTWRGRVRADVKGKLASSTTAQMGYMAIQLGIGLPAAALLHLVGHGYYKAWLFLRAGGAVTRARWHPSRAVGTGRHGVAGVALTLGVGVLTALIAAPAVDGSFVALGPAALLPALLALATVTVAASRLPVTTTGVVSGVVVALLGAAYPWFLYGWESAFATDLPLAPVWAAPAAALWLVAVAAVGVVTAVGVVVLGSGGAPSLWTRLARTTLPPTVSRRLRRSGRTVLLPSLVDRGGSRFGRGEAAALLDVTGSLMGPVWPLRDLVAANSLSGTVGLPFADIDASARDVHGASVYLTPTQFLRLFDNGEISASAVEQALVRLDHRPGAARPHSLGNFLDATRAIERQWCSGDQLPPARTDDVVAAVTGLWCRAAWSDTATAATGPWREMKRRADSGRADSGLDTLCGCAGASEWLRALPDDPLAAVAELLGYLPDDHCMDAGFEVIRSLPGWSGHAQWRVRQGQTDALGSVVATHLALSLLQGQPAGTRVPDSEYPGTWPPLAEVWQRALEFDYRDDLLAGLNGAAGPDHGTEAQAVVRASLVFCIDVRSERMRRAIERSGPYRTYGYAGFFGAAVRYTAPDGARFDQCPALISPTRQVVTDPVVANLSVPAVLRDAQEAVASAPVLPFLVAEFGGLAAGAASATQTGAPHRWQRWAGLVGATPQRWGPRDLNLGDEAGVLPRVAAAEPAGYSLADLTALAADFLRLTGASEPFGELIVIVGHGATVENNAFAAGYDCGACGGNSGHINARVLAYALNHPEVREALAERGWTLPESCSAIAAVHDTTTDDIAFDPYSEVDPGALAALRTDLDAARDAVIAERRRVLPEAPGGSIDRDGRRAVQRRSADWAAPIPEWGLAGNAAFVVGPRRLTEHLDLDGRVFLHSYDAATDDAEASALRTILTAPVVVAHWINSQYYLSTVAPDTFGAGDKTTHNVVGDIGVTSGAHGDLRVGLPWQSVRPVAPDVDSRHSTSGGHLPLRLLVVVAASPRSIAAIVADDPTVAGLVASGWITLVALPADGAEPVVLRPDLQWVPWSAPDGTRTTARIDGLAGRA